MCTRMLVETAETPVLYQETAETPVVLYQETAETPVCRK